MSRGIIKMNKYFKISELSRLYDIGTDTIRYYEDQGLIHPVRGENGYRLYRIQDIWRMNVIRDLRGLGFPVARIREYLKNRSIESTRTLLEEELALIEKQAKRLRRLKKTFRNDCPPWPRPPRRTSAWWRRYDYRSDAAFKLMRSSPPMKRWIY